MARSTFEPQKINIPRARLRFVDLYTTKVMKNDPTSKPRYGCTPLLDPQDPKHYAVMEKIKAETERCIAHEFPNGRPPRLLTEFFGRGEDKTNQTTGTIYPGFAGMYFVSAYAPEKRPPVLLSTQRKPDGSFAELTPGDERLYEGVFANVTVHLYKVDNTKFPQAGNRISCFLRAVQTLGYGDKIAGFDVKREFEDFDASDYEADDNYDQRLAATNDFGGL